LINEAIDQLVELKKLKSATAMSDKLEELPLHVKKKVVGT
jgi:hypothetical protein